MAKRSGRVRSDQSSCGSIGLQVKSSCESIRVDPYFSNKFLFCFFFFFFFFLK